MSERLRKAGHYQIASLIVFLLAGLNGAFALIIEQYAIVALCVVFMIANMVIYRINGRIIADELARR